MMIGSHTPTQLVLIAGLSLFAFGFRFAFGRGFLLRHLADAVRDVIHYVKSCNALLLKEINSV